MQLVVDGFGWLGMVLVLLAYLLLSAKKIGAQSVPYQLMNVVGSGCLAFNVWHQQSVPSTVLNVIWMIIGITVLYRNFVRKKYGQQKQN